MIIVQNSIGAHTVLTDFTGPIHQAYADAHGYTYMLLSLPVPSNCTVLSWSKVAAIIQALGSAADNEVVLSIDTDALILPRRKSEALDSILPDDKDFGIVRATVNLCGKPSQLNAGVMFIKKNSATVAFFNSVLSLGPIDPTSIPRRWHSGRRSGKNQ